MEQTNCATIYALWNHGPMKGTSCMFPWLDGRIDQEVGLTERIEYVRNYMVRDGFVPVAWALKGTGCHDGIPHAIAVAVAAGRAIDLIAGKYIARGITERGEPIETAPETTLGQILHDMLIGKTVKRVSCTAEPKRAPLRYFTERAQFDPFKGYVTKSSTQHQEPQSSFGRLVSPDMQDNGPQTNPGFGSAALVVKG